MTCRDKKSERRHKRACIV